MQLGDAVVLLLRARLGRVTGLRIAHEVLDNTRERLLVRGGLGRSGVVDAGDVGQTLIARGALEVLAALLLDRTR